MRITKRHFLRTCLLAVLAAGCDYLDVKPVGKVIPETTSEYRALLTTGYSSFPNYKKMLALRADEVFPALYTVTYSSNLPLALLDDNTNNLSVMTYPWSQMYKVIFYANSVYSGVKEAETDTRDSSDAVRQLQGEALLLRAYAHFELLNLYARPYNKETAATDRGIPLSLEMDVNKEYYPRTVEEVYTQVLADIAGGISLLQLEEQPAAVRYRFSRKAARALEARVRLYRSEWEQALAVAAALLPSCPLEDLNAPDFKPPYHYQSVESVLALELTGGLDISDDTDVLSNLTGKYDAEGDLRLATWFAPTWSGGYRPAKCDDKSMRVSIRSAEIYLIAAEAAAHLSGKLGDAKAYLKQLLEKRLTPACYVRKAAEVDAMNQEQLIAEIADERARELAIEGHRWYDLRRTTRPEIVKVYTDANFEEQRVVIRQNDSRYVIPFPKEATESNPHLKD